MPVIRKSTTVNAPAEKIFEILDAPARIIEYALGVTRVSGFHQTPQRVGDTGRISYSAIGLRFPMKFTTAAYEKNARVTLAFEGGMRGTMDWSLESQGGGTRLNLVIDYTMRGGIIGKALNALMVERMNEKNAERMLENLKMLSEG